MPKVRKNSYGVGVDYFWKEYKKKVKDKTFFDINQSTYKKILYDINKEAMRLMIEDNQVLFLPYSLGQLSIVKKPAKIKNIKQFPIDWQETKKQGKHIRLFNTHTGFHIMEFYWDKTLIKGLRYGRFYKFVPSRKNKRNLGKEIKTNKNHNYNTHGI